MAVTIKREGPYLLLAAVFTVLVAWSGGKGGSVVLACMLFGCAAALGPAWKGVAGVGAGYMFAATLLGFTDLSATLWVNGGPAIEGLMAIAIALVVLVAPASLRRRIRTRDTPRIWVPVALALGGSGLLMLSMLLAVSGRY